MHLSTLLATATLLSTVLADGVPGRRPQITAPAALLNKRILTCEAATDTPCADGTGCCGVGEACAWKSVTIPICKGTCDSPPVYCTGAYSGLCCDAGSSCDYADQGLCTATGFVFSSMSVPTFVSAVDTSTFSGLPSESSVPSFSPFIPSSTEDVTTESTAAASTSVKVVTVGAPSSSRGTTTRRSSSTTDATVLQQSTAGVGKGIEVVRVMEVVVVGGLGLLAGL